MTRLGHSRRTGAINSSVELPFGSGDRDMRFVDRYDAGRRLAVHLAAVRGEDLVVVGIPRGGVAVAAEVARALGAPLDVVVVRKIGAPGKPEYAIGALAEGDVSVISDEAVRGVGLGAVDLELVVGRARRELARRVARYSADRTRLSVAGRTVLSSMYPRLASQRASLPVTVPDALSSSWPARGRSSAGLWSQLAAP